MNKELRRAAQALALLGHKAKEQEAAARWGLAELLTDVRGSEHGEKDDFAIQHVEGIFSHTKVSRVAYWIGHARYSGDFADFLVNIEADAAEKAVAWARTLLDRELSFDAIVNLNDASTNEWTNVANREAWRGKMDALRAIKNIVSNLDSGFYEEPPAE